MEKAQKEKCARGRPKKEKDKLCRSINLKLTERDFETIEKKAADIGMKTTQYAREMTLKGRIKPRYTKEELDLRRKVAGMCNNVNQIAKHANQSGIESIHIEAVCVLGILRKLLDDR